ncbi:MAG: hypothetical protein ACK5YR_03520 [Pirellula sp.]
MFVGLCIDPWGGRICVLDFINHRIKSVKVLLFKFVFLKCECFVRQRKR